MGGWILAARERTEGGRENLEGDGGKMGAVGCNAHSHELKVR